MLPFIQSFFVVAVLAVPLILVWQWQRAQALCLPPGPKWSWVAGVDIPKLYPWRTYTQWKDEYGDVVYIYAFMNSIVVLNSIEAISDLLEKRSGNYSSRPVRTMVQELMGWDWLFSSMSYGNRWKRHRNLFQKHFPINGTSEHHPLQIKQTHALLRDLEHSPTEFSHHIRRTAAANVLDITYGIHIDEKISENGDDYVKLATSAILPFSRAGIFGTYMVDYIPALKYLPLWCAPFKRKAKEWRKPAQALVNRPFEVVQTKMENGTAIPCIVAHELDDIALGRGTTDLQVVKNVAATTFAAGADTVVSALQSLFLAIALYPNVHDKAQKELDRDIGFRKALAVFPNVWAVFHDPELYPDPFTFNPDRFEDNVIGKGLSASGVNEIPNAAFGFGRRMCPGRWFAFDFLWISVASILSVYKITEATDVNRHPIDLIGELYSSGLVSHPLPFKCQIEPRSPAAKALIEETNMEA
ncbi:cytochrome P450 [Armillaria novae-zelandiae]|uniref:Cytochrome P450 n=1 Tax=Armillaria novae-zelandiae TaxID=153914 RepID=A0AA39P7N3_9AGAR|nr:cytochrome P450 [Armillaria novae-zelandiae]